MLKVQRPLRQGEGAVDEVALMKKGAALIGMLQPLQQRADVEAYARATAPYSRPRPSSAAACR